MAAASARGFIVLRPAIYMPSKRFRRLPGQREPLHRRADRAILGLFAESRRGMEINFDSAASYARGRASLAA
jgi:hypothetical protein